jgi:hypothetical protein
MCDYKCEYCGKCFTKSNNMYRHAKYNCKVAHEIKETDISPRDAVNLIKDNQEKQDNNICYCCDKKFSCYSSMRRHIKNNCKVVKEKKNDKEQIYNELKKLREENEKMKKELNAVHAPNLNNNGITINGGVNNGTIVNNAINITISFGKEDMSKIDEIDIVKSVKNGFHSALELTDTIHFNPKYPEYHNVYIPSMKDKYGMVYKEGIWELIDKQELIDKIYNDKKYYIEDNADTFYDSMSKSQKNALRRWLLIDNDDDEKIKSIKDRMKLLLYNKRSVPIDTKNAKRLASK